MVPIDSKVDIGEVILTSVWEELIRQTSFVVRCYSLQSRQNALFQTVLSKPLLIFISRCGAGHYQF
jgi:hypothetical protein